MFLVVYYLLFVRHFWFDFANIVILSDKNVCFTKNLIKNTFIFKIYFVTLQPKV